MPAALPPMAASPLVVPQAPGTGLWRIHHNRWAPAAFNSAIREGAAAFDPLTERGGRFDATRADPYPYWYGASDTVAAVAEALLRDRVTPTPTFVRRGKLAQQVLSRVVVKAAIDLVQLHGAGLSPIGQDAWLSSCGVEGYGITREWSRAIRRWSAGAQGLVWRSRLDNDRFAYILFEDRMPAGALDCLASYRLDGGQNRGLALVRQALARHGAVLS